MHADQTSDTGSISPLHIDSGCYLTAGGLRIARLLQLRSLSKQQRRRAVRWGGTLAAMLQLGSIFAATRALRTEPRRQRLVAMDLR